MSMAQGTTLVYDRIGANRRNTVLLLAVFIILVGGVLVAMGILIGLPYNFAPVLIVPAILYALFAYYASTGVTLAISNAHPVTKEQEPEYYRTVENLSIGAGLPMPKLYVIEDSAPNAFATGRNPKNAVMCVTRGLLQQMDHLELEGVCAHELSHIGNYDIRLETMVVVLVGLVALLADFTLRLTIWGAGARPSNRGRSGGSGVVIVYALALIAAILAPIAAQLIQMALSRQREYLADASGALLTRYPEGLASALEKIAKDNEPLADANKATAHLYIANPLNEHQSWLNSLFDTHPPIQERIRRLRAM
jgi:heat shock protein HtpX